MKSKLKKLLRPFLFTVGGALAGLGYYYVVGCSTGSCPITSNPIITMIYMGVVGLLLNPSPMFHPTYATVYIF